MRGSDMELRTDLQLISEWVAPGSRILDLGCGDGTLLRHLRDTRQVTGYGLELDPDNVIACVDAGLNVIHTNLDDGLKDYFDDDSFDVVVMSQALQVMRFPSWTLSEMLRVGREGIVTFPNFGHWQCRLQLGLGGRMPVSRTLPATWYDTQNIHLCTFRDFEALCREKNIRILERTVVDHAHRTSLGMRLLPNLLGEVAIYRFTKYA